MAVFVATKLLKCHDSIPISCPDDGGRRSHVRVAELIGTMQALRSEVLLLRSAKNVGGVTQDGGVPE